MKDEIPGTVRLRPNIKQCKALTFQMSRKQSTNCRRLPAASNHDKIKRPQSHLKTTLQSRTNLANYEKQQIGPDTGHLLYFYLREVTFLDSLISMQTWFISKIIDRFVSSFKSMRGPNGAIRHICYASDRTAMVCAPGVGRAPAAGVTETPQFASHYPLLDAAGCRNV